MKQRLVYLIAGLFCATYLTAQPPKIELPQYTIMNVPLSADMDKQVCISGLKFHDGKLYLASERCPVVFIADPANGNITGSVNMQVPKNFEMEGITSYKDKLYLVSENDVAVYEVTIPDGSIRIVETSIPLPPKSKDGDGMEGIAANEIHDKFYLLRERNEDMTKSQIYTFGIERDKESNNVKLKYESMIELPLLSSQWRYSDICYDKENSRLICLKSFSKGKLRQQFIESISIDNNGQLQVETLANIPVDKFSEISNEYKDQKYSMNLEGITVDTSGTIFIVSDNTSGKALCDQPSKEKTILLRLSKQ